MTARSEPKTTRQSAFEEALEVDRTRGEYLRELWMRLGPWPDLQAKLEEIWPQMARRWTNAPEMPSHQPADLPPDDGVALFSGAIERAASKMRKGGSQ